MIAIQNTQIWFLHWISIFFLLPMEVLLPTKKIRNESECHTSLYSAYNRCLYTTYTQWITTLPSWLRYSMFESRITVHLVVGERAEILAWKLRRKWQAKPELSPTLLSNPSWSVTLVSLAMNIIIRLWISLTTTRLALGAFVSDESH